MKKIVIVSPRQMGGGPIVLHLLCKLLMERGYDAKIFYIGPMSMKQSAVKYWLEYFSFLRHDTSRLCKARVFSKAEFIKKGRYNGYHYAPVKGCVRKYTPIVDHNTIVVYPEVIWGNPLRAKHVVRWFLFHNRYPGDYEAYGKNDLFFSYREVFNDPKVNPTCRLLKLTNFDYDLYQNYNKGERSGTCYIVRKGAKRTDIPENFDGVVIDSLSEKEIVDTFNHSKYCISYDTQTFYSTIAAICGCISIVMPEPGKTRADYTQKDDKIYGVAYGDTEEEMKFAVETKPLLVDKINAFREENEKGVDFFLQACENYFR